MICHPEVAKKAQAEIDRVLKGRNQLPTLDDRPDLPYVDCILKEVLRYVNSKLTIDVYLMIKTIQDQPACSAR